MPRWKRKVNKKMKIYGEIDYDNKVIAVNPAKGEILDTILHEELHKRFPRKREETIRKMANEKEKELTINQAIKLLTKYK